MASSKTLEKSVTSGTGAALTVRYILDRNDVL
jgi:hypothetical protein